MSYFDSIYSDADLPARARLVYMYLQDRANKDSSCWPAIKTIARDLKLSRSTVKRALRDLEQGGYLKKQVRFRKNGSYTSNFYVIANGKYTSPYTL